MIGVSRFTLSQAGTLTRIRGSRLSGQFAGRQVVLSRALCAFDRFDVSNKMTDSQLRRASLLQARARSPFSDPGVFMSLDGDMARVWTWDQSPLDRIGVPEAQVVPETELHPVTDGFALRACIDGFEAQIFEAGRLVQSRWWPTQPSLGDVRLFLSSSPVATDAGSLSLAAEVTEDAVRNASAPVSDAEILQIGRTANRRALVATGLALVLLPALYQGVRLMRVSQIEAGLQAEVTQMRETLGPKRRLAGELNRAVNTLQAYADAKRTAEPLMAIADILTVFDGNDATITGLTVADGAISITLQFGPDVSINEVAIVSELETKAAIDAVTMFRGRRDQQWIVEANLVVDDDSNANEAAG